MTLGAAPDAGDSLYAFITTSAGHGLRLATLTGGGTSWKMSPAPPAGSNVLLYVNGLCADEATGPLNPDQFSISGAQVTLGTAILSTDTLDIYVQVAASAPFKLLTLSGAQDSNNTDFAISLPALPVQYSVQLLAIYSGEELQVSDPAIDASPGYKQYQLIKSGTGTIFRVGIAPDPGDYLDVYLIGIVKGPVVNPYTLTCENIRNKVSIYLQNGVDPISIETAADDQYRLLLDSYQLSFLKYTGAITTSAPISTGTLTLSQNTFFGTGSGTVFTKDHVGWKLRVGNSSNGYTITDVDEGSQEIAFTPAFQDVGGSALAYSIYQNVYPVDPAVRELLSMAYQMRLRKTTQERIDRSDPDRVFTSDVPQAYAPAGVDASGSVQVEISPVPSRAVVIRYLALRRDICLDDAQTLLGLEMAVVYQTCVAGCLMAAAKPENKNPMLWLQLHDKYLPMAEKALDRLLTIDFGKFTVPMVQASRDDEMWVGDEFAATHDVALLGGRW